LVEPDKGTGLVMVCTFGDVTDVVWWRELGLPVRSVLSPDGRLAEVPWGSPGWESQDLDRARENYDELKGKTVNQARRRSIELLEQAGALVGESQQVAIELDGARHVVGEDREVVDAGGRHVRSIRDPEG